MHLSNKLASNDLILHLTDKFPCIKKPLSSAIYVYVYKIKVTLQLLIDFNRMQWIWR